MEWFIALKSMLLILSFSSVQQILSVVLYILKLYVLHLKNGYNAFFDDVFQVMLKCDQDT